MKPYTYHHNLRIAQTTERRATLIAQPEIAEPIGKALSNLVTGLTVFGGCTLMLSGFSTMQIAEAARMAGGIAGAGLLIKTLAMAKPVLFWLEILTNSDINEDGIIGEPPKPTGVIPSTNYAEIAHDAALKLWDFTHSQIRAATEDGRKLKGKPWSRRTAMKAIGLTHEGWDWAIDVWVAGGLLRTRDARTLETTSYKRGLDYIDSGMAMDFMRSNGQSWIPRALSYSA